MKKCTSRELFGQSKAADTEATSKQILQAFEQAQKDTLQSAKNEHKANTSGTFGGNTTTNTKRRTILNPLDQYSNKDQSSLSLLQ